MSKNTTTALTVDQIAEIASKAAIAAVAKMGLTAEVEEPTKARKGKGGTTAVRTTVSSSALRTALKAHKAAKAIPYGVTVEQAIAQGLMLGDGTLPTGKGKAPKAGKAKKAKAVEGTPFPELRARLVLLKAEGLVPAGISVREAQAQGLIDEEARLITGKPAKAGKKGKGKGKGKKAQTEAVVAEVVADAPAKERPRPVGADMPRRANGTITPREEWDLRERLAMSGDFDRFEIDKIVKREMKAQRKAAKKAAASA